MSKASSRVSCLEWLLRGLSLLSLVRNVFMQPHFSLH